MFLLKKRIKQLKYFQYPTKINFLIKGLVLNKKYNKILNYLQLAKNLKKKDRIGDREINLMKFK